MRTKQIDKDLERRQAQLAGFHADVEQVRREISEYADARKPLLLAAAEGDTDAAARLGELTDRLQDARQRAEDGAELITQCEAAIAALEDERAAVEREAHYDKVRALTPTRTELAERIVTLTTELVETVKQHSDIAVRQAEAVRATGDHDGANAIASSDALDRWLTAELSVLRARPIRVLRTLEPGERVARRPLLDVELALLAPFMTNDAAAVAA